MMLRSIRIRNWQSLTDVELRLGSFTVITGPSSSGKSALVRAMKSAMTNPRGTKAITHGQTRSAVSLSDDSFTVDLERSASGSKYVLEVAGESETYTKIAGVVPDPVAAVFNVSDRNFAGQFDRPYLLSESGSAVAQTLGDLTGASRVFDAAKESQRRRLGVRGDLKVRHADLAEVRDLVETFVDLPERIARVAEAEAVLQEAETLSERITQLAGLLARTTLPPPPEPFDFVSVDKAVGLAERLGELVAEVREEPSSDAVDAALVRVTQIQSEIAEVEVCPTCGQEIS